MAAQMAQSTGRSFYPDANLTLRLTYGHIKGIDPDGPAGYAYQTNIDEIMAKDQPDNEEFRVPERSKELFAAKDYGRWGIPLTVLNPATMPGFNAATPSPTKTTAPRTVPVAFLADNHTTGGNSGSPVLNAKGQLIGTNFDRIWEGTMSDLYFDPALCRNISVDVRYTLWVIEKFGGAGLAAERDEAGEQIMMINNRRIRGLLFINIALVALLIAVCVHEGYLTRVWKRLTAPPTRPFVHTDNPHFAEALDFDTLYHSHPAVVMLGTSMTQKMDWVSCSVAAMCPPAACMAI